MTKKEIKRYMKNYIPEGWYKAFGKQLVKELTNELIKENYLDDFEIGQIKEKYGGLRIYIGPAPESIHKIINKYEDMSFNYCQVCGKPGRVYDNGWIMTLCPVHAEKLNYKEEHVV